MKDVKKLKSSIDDNLYEIFLRSNVSDWKLDDYGLFVYLYENMRFSFKKDKGNLDVNELRMTIHSTSDDAKNSGKYGSYNETYRIVHLLTCKWYNPSRIKKTYHKTKRIIDNYENKKEYDKLKIAFDALPLKIQRKQKLSNIENN